MGNTILRLLSTLTLITQARRFVVRDLTSNAALQLGLNEGRRWMRVARQVKPALRYRERIYKIPLVQAAGSTRLETSASQLDEAARGGLPQWPAPCPPIQLQLLSSRRDLHR